MCETLYQLLLEYFDSGKNAKNRQEIELNACRYTITFLLPATLNRMEKCEEEKDRIEYYKLYIKSMAFAGRRSLEHFFEYMEMNNTKRVLERT